MTKKKAAPEQENGLFQKSIDGLGKFIVHQIYSKSNSVNLTLTTIELAPVLERTIAQVNHQNSRHKSLEIIPARAISKLIDAVNDRDREFFAANPLSNCYIRPYVPGEIYPATGDFDVVQVWRILPGVRARVPMMTWEVA